MRALPWPLSRCVYIYRLFEKSVEQVERNEGVAYNFPKVPAGLSNCSMKRAKADEILLGEKWILASWIHLATMRIRR